MDATASGYIAAAATIRNGEMVYINSLDQGEQHRVAEAYGPNYQRLRRVKAAWDPDNFFRGNQNIAPAPGERP
jgi:FAD/FMN-containing dehydrogenase